jgi:predicted  nucleic acid-binding Zn-ribbon protein
MPHQCTDCGRTFEDGSKEMLSGCPDCGGNKFQFHPDGVDADAGTEEPPEPPEPAVDSSVARTVGNAATTVRDLVGADSSPSEAPESTAETPADPAGDASTAGESIGSPDSTPSPEPATGEMAETEDEAQASARSEVVRPEDLPPASETEVDDTAHSSSSGPDRETPPEEATAGMSGSPAPSSSDESSTDREERPGLSELREELNEQFESIRVLEPGQYELNLMSLYDREEYIIALQEDGKYTIQVPERWED